MSTVPDALQFIVLWKSLFWSSEVRLPRFISCKGHVCSISVTIGISILTSPRGIVLTVSKTLPASFRRMVYCPNCPLLVQVCWDVKTWEKQTPATDVRKLLLDTNFIQVSSAVNVFRKMVNNVLTKSHSQWHLASLQGTLAQEGKGLPLNFPRRLGTASISVMKTASFLNCCDIYWETWNCIDISHEILELPLQISLYHFKLVIQDWDVRVHIFWSFKAGMSGLTSSSIESPENNLCCTCIEFQCVWGHCSLC